MQHSFIRNFHFLSNFSSTNNLVKLSGTNVIMPFYHIVSNENLPHIKHLYFHRNTKQFENELDFYLKHFAPISLNDLINNNLSQKKKYFFLSFDDGFKECYEIIAPILLKKGIPATFFVNTSFIDNKKLFYKLKASLVYDKFIHNLSNNSTLADTTNILKNNYSEEKINDLAKLFDINFDNFLKTKKPYLTSEQIHWLLNNGFDIGSHSSNHRQYNNLSTNEQITETISSINYLQENFNIKHKSFSFPFTDFEVSNEFFEAIKQHIEISFGTAGIKLDSIKNNFQRIPIEEFNISAQKIVKTEYLYFVLLKLIGKHIIKR